MKDLGFMIFLDVTQASDSTHAPPYSSHPPWAVVSQITAMCDTHPSSLDPLPRMGKS